MLQTPTTQAQRLTFPRCLPSPSKHKWPYAPLRRRQHSIFRLSRSCTSLFHWLSTNLWASCWRCCGALCKQPFFVFSRFLHWSWWPLAYLRVRDTPSSSPVFPVQSGSLVSLWGSCPCTYQAWIFSLFFPAPHNWPFTGNRAWTSSTVCRYLQHLNGIWARASEDANNSSPCAAAPSIRS